MPSLAWGWRISSPCLGCHFTFLRVLFAAQVLDSGGSPVSLFFWLSFVHFVLGMKTGALWLSSGEGRSTSHGDLVRFWWSSQAGAAAAVGQTNDPGIKHIWVPILSRQLLFLVTGVGHSMPLNLSLSICTMEIVTPTLGVAVRLDKGVQAQGICLMNIARVTMASRFPKEGPQLPSPAACCRVLDTETHTCPQMTGIGTQGWEALSLRPMDFSPEPEHQA